MMNQFEQEAFDWGYVTINSNNSVKIACDCWSVSTGSGRGSVRITSYGTWDYGLFIADLEHMPEGCGTWPAWWLVGPDWPNGGEIDIIEGVNNQIYDQSTLHTSSGCTMPAGTRPLHAQAQAHAKATKPGARPAMDGNMGTHTSQRPAHGWPWTQQRHTARARRCRFVAPSRATS